MTHKIEEKRSYKSNGEIQSVFYLYKPFLFFFRRYVETCGDCGCFKRGFSNYHEAKNYEEVGVIKTVKYRW